MDRAAQHVHDLVLGVRVRLDVRAGPQVDVEQLECLAVVREVRQLVDGVRLLVVRGALRKRAGWSALLLATCMLLGGAIFAGLVGAQQLLHGPRHEIETGALLFLSGVLGLPRPGR